MIVAVVVAERRAVAFNAVARRPTATKAIALNPRGLIVKAAAMAHNRRDKTISASNAATNATIIAAKTAPIVTDGRINATCNATAAMTTALNIRAVATTGGTTIGAMTAGIIIPAIARQTATGIAVAAIMRHRAGIITAGSA